MVNNYFHNIINLYNYFFFLTIYYKTIMGLPTTGTLSFSQINECVRFTNGNVGINTTAPASALDVNGAIQATGITVSNLNITGAIYQNGSSYQASQWTTTSGNVSYTSGSAVVTNLVSTNASTGTLYASGLSSLQNISATDVTAATITATTGITAENINITGSLFQNGAVYSGSQWTTTSGNVSYTSGSVIATNLQSTSASTGALNASTGITTATIFSSNARLTTMTSSNIVVTSNITSGGLYVQGTAQFPAANITAATISNLQVGLRATAANMCITQTLLVPQASTISNIVSTSITTGTLSATTLNATTGITTATLLASTGITTAGLAATTITGGNMSLSGNLSIAGTLTAVNVTTTNLIDTNISTGTLTASGLSTLTNVTATGITSGSIMLASGGSLALQSTSSGSVTLTTQTSSGNYNFNLPTTSGSSGQVLVSGGGGSAPMTWGNNVSPATLVRYNTSAPSIPNASGTIVQFNAQYDPYSAGTTGIGYSNGIFTNNNSSAITVQVNYTLAFQNNSTGNRTGYIMDNNGIVSGNGKVPAVNGDNTNVVGSGILTLAAGGSFSLYAFQNSGTSLTIGSGPTPGGNASHIHVSVINGGFVVPGNGGSALSRYHNTTQSIANTTNATVLFDTLDTNNSQGMTGFSYSNGVFTNSTASPITIIITANLAFANNTTGTRAAWIASSAAAVARLGFVEQIPNTTGFSSLNPNCVATIPASGTFAVVAYQSSGSALNLNGGTGPSTTLQITPISGYSGNINATGITTGTLNITGSGNPLRFSSGSTTQALFQDFQNGNGARGIIGLDGSNYAGFNTGAFLISTWSNNPLNFATNQTQRMTITTDGNVGIGTTNPGAALDVSGIENWGLLRLANRNAGSFSALGFFYDNTFTASNGATNGNWYVGTGGTGTSNFTIYKNGGANNWFNINSSGNVGIGTASPNAILHANGRFRAGANGTTGTLLVSNDSDGYVYMGQALLAAPTGDARLNVQDRSNNYISFYGGTTKAGSITVNGGGVAYNTSSDYRVKENVVNLTGACSRVNQLSVKRFNFISHPSITVDGFIAHEVATVVPEAVTGEKDAVDANGDPILQAIDQSKLVPLLTAALKESISRIESLESFIESKFPDEYP
jgi:hypothetical protein